MGTKVGLVIITYNNEDHIRHTIESVRKQTLIDWVCVLVDNGSTDRTHEVALEEIDGDRRFSAYKKSNEGPAAGRNYGFARLPENVEFLHFLDGDDKLHPEFLEKLTSYLQQNPKVGAVACQFDEIDNDGNYLGKGHRSRFAPNSIGLPADIPLHIYETPFVSFFSSTAVGPFVVYRRSVFVKTNGFELKSQEDTDMYCKMRLLAEVHYLPEYLYIKRRHPNNLAHKKSYTKTHYAFREKWDTYYSDNPEVNKLIEKCLKYYYTRHKPLRAFKVAAKAFRKFLSRRDPHSLKWSFQCIGEGLGDIFLRTSYRRVKRKRIDKISATIRT
ncbi:MAG: glycosyltransferase family 2 protein [Cryomorphaceae bacterium]|nr:glycosyltransferase [Flavobacteriales bacterium]